MNAFLALIYKLLDLYSLVVIIHVVFSWLIAFQIINTHNRFVRMVADALFRMVDPVCRQIRRILPSMGGIDFSPVILILLIFFIQRLLVDAFGPQITYL